MHIRIRKWVKLTFTILLIISTVILYSIYIEPKLFKVNEYSIIDKNIPNNFYGFKIVQISDIHYKVTTDLNDLNKIIKQINLLKPDIIIFNGDLFDKNISYTNEDYNDLTTFLKSLNYNIGKYAIKGDNDLNNQHWDDIINNSNFYDISNKSEYIYYEGLDPILINGISSDKNIDYINEINFDNIKYSILVLHEPDIINEIDTNNYNLILGGHSLGGQITIPYYGGLIKSKGSTNYNKNYFKINNANIYISNGIGNSKYKFRFLNVPSINFFRLRNK